MDLEVSASGFTKQMEKHLLIEMGIEEDSDEDCNDDDDDDNNTESGNLDSSEIDLLRLSCEQSLLESERSMNSTMPTTSEKSTDLKNLEHNFENISLSNKEVDRKKISFSNVLDEESFNKSVDKAVNDKKNSISIINTDEHKNLTDNPEEQSCGEKSLDNLSDDESNYAESEAFSVAWTTSTTTSTIPPDVIKSRVKKALEKREIAIIKKRCKAKGEASATMRKRRENSATVKDYEKFSEWE